MVFFPCVYSIIRLGEKSSQRWFIYSQCAQQRGRTEQLQATPPPTNLDSQDLIAVQSSQRRETRQSLQGQTAEHGTTHAWHSNTWVNKNRWRWKKISIPLVNRVTHLSSRQRKMCDFKSFPAFPSYLSKANIKAIRFENQTFQLRQNHDQHLI